MRSSQLSRFINIIRLAFLCCGFWQIQASAQELGFPIYSVDRCQGGYQYKDSPVCRSSSFACEIYGTKPKANTCRNCVLFGVEKYDSCPSKSCAGYVPRSVVSTNNKAVKPDTFSPSCPTGQAVTNQKSKLVPGPKENYLYTWDCEIKEVIKSCENDSCAALSCKEGQDAKECGTTEVTDTSVCKQYVERAPVDTTVCGLAAKEELSPRAVKATEYPTPVRQKLSGDTVETFVVSKYRFDSKQTGSACLTCDDIPLDSPEHVTQRFDCLAKTIDLMEQEKIKLSFQSTRDIVQIIRNIWQTHAGVWLDAKRTEKAEAILSAYPI